MCSAEPQHVGAEAGDHLAGDRSREHAGAVEHAQLGDRAVRRGRRVADLFDGQQRQTAGGLRVRVLVPLADRPHEGTDQARVDEFGLEFERRPSGDRRRDLVPII